MTGRHLAVSDRFVGKPLLVLLEQTEPELSSTYEITPVFGLVNRDGSAKDRLPVTVEVLRSLYAEMVEARRFDDMSSAMHRRGLLAMHEPVRGQEAAQIGAAASIRPGDWVVASYADPVLCWRAGHPWNLVMLWLIGDERGGRVSKHVNILPPTTPSGCHTIHAVGLALAEKLKGTGRIALSTAGDEADSAGCFHQAINLAVAHQTPSVFFYRSETPVPEPATNQRHTHSIADIAEASGMPGVRVDGRDVLAVLVTVQEAAERARRGDGPSLIEAVMNYAGSPGTEEDSSRNRRDSKVNGAETGDPLDRIRRLLETAGAWTREWQEELEQSASQRIKEAASFAVSQPPPTAQEMIERMYATPTAQLLEQLREAADD